MKIAVVTPEYPPDTIGGGGVAVQALARAYAAEHEVRVFSGWDSTRSWFGTRTVDSVESLTVHRYPLIPVGRRKAYLKAVVPPNLAAWIALRSDLSAWMPDVAHLHGYGSALTDLAANRLARLGVPYIFTIHGLPTTPMHHHPAVRAAYRAYQRLGAGATLGRARSVTAVSDAVARAAACGVPVLVIPNGVTPLPLSDPGRAALLRNRLALSSEVPVIVAAGRLAMSKGFDVLIKALNHVPVPKLACVIAGSDAGAKELLCQLSNRTRQGVSVSLPGHLNRVELADLFSLATVVVVPSREEPFGLVALEALAMGRRLVASCTGGLAEFLNPRVARLVPPDDVPALASAIALDLASGHLTRHDLRQVDELLSTYSWGAAARQYQRLMSNALTA